MVTIPSGGGGTFFGGYLVKRLNLRFAGILRLCLVTTGIVLCLTLTLLYRCDNIPFVGVNVDYTNHNRYRRLCWMSHLCASIDRRPCCGCDRKAAAAAVRVRYLNKSYTTSLFVLYIGECGIWLYSDGDTNVMPYSK